MNQLPSPSFTRPLAPTMPIHASSDRVTLPARAKVAAPTGPVTVAVSCQSVLASRSR